MSRFRWLWRISSALSLQLVMVCEAQALLRMTTEEHVAASAQDLVNRKAEPFLHDSCHVGLSIAIVRGSQTEFYNFGSISRTIYTKPTADNIYEIASVTKTFTGVLAARALLEHRMQLDADFRSYLPGRYPQLQWQGHPITLRTLATHTSGLPRDLPDTDDLYARKDPETIPYQLIARESAYDRARYLAELHQVVLRGMPGTDENYSNLGFKVIGWGLEQVYDMPFEKLLDGEVLRPLQMRSTTFVLDADQRSRLVSGYSPAGRLMPYHLRNAGAAYGLYSTARDMAKYVAWQLEQDNPQIGLDHEPIEGTRESGKALAWNLGVLDGSQAQWHGGGTFGMSSQVVLFPSTHEGIVLLANDTCHGTESALRDLAVALHSALAGH